MRESRATQPARTGQAGSANANPFVREQAIIIGRQPRPLSPPMDERHGEPRSTTVRVTASRAPDRPRLEARYP